MPKTLIAGNWKMNGLKASLEEIRAVANGLPETGAVEALLCVPATLVASASAAAEGSALSIGGETCHPSKSGAHTGDISAEMLADAGASHVIIGHSERRSDHGETDAIVAAQASAAHRAGLIPIICVGESLSQRENRQALDVIKTQLSGSLPDSAPQQAVVIAYEPIWAIGTGKVADTAQIGEVHDYIRTELARHLGARGENTPILYGGSMKPANAEEILIVENVNGGLIGGASLKASDFLAIFNSATI